MQAIQQYTKSEKLNISTKEVSKRIRQQLKEEFKDYKFSVTTEYYSMGSSIHISIMQSPIKLVMSFEDIPQTIIDRKIELDNYSIENLQNLQNNEYHQLNDRLRFDEYDPSKWNNGVFLTKEGHEVVKRVADIAHQYNWDNSDAMIDYFDVKYYVHLNLGKWNKPFIDGV